MTRKLLLAVYLFYPCASMAQSSFGTNLILNGNAESGPGVGSNTIVSSIPNWTSNGANVITYASGFGIKVGDIVPVNAGKNYFSNGTTASSLTQTASLSFATSVIDAGAATFDASGYFGGYSDYDDAASMTIAFLNASGGSLSSITIGGLKSVDRDSSGLYLRRQIGAIPVGARSAKVTVNFTYTSGNNNSGADNLSLIVNSPSTLPPAFGNNLILDGDAEQSVQRLVNVTVSADIPNWVRTPFFAANLYGDPSSDLALTDPAPPDRGKFYFYGGSSNSLSPPIRT